MAFKIEVEKILTEILQIENPSRIIIIGDFNFNVINNTENFLSSFMGEYGLKNKLNISEPTTNFNTQIDIIFSNIKNLKTGVYESYFSYHKPVFFQI